MSHFPDDTGQFDLEPVERRGDLRGHLDGVEATLSDGTVVPVLEGSHLGLFVAIGSPDDHALSDVQGITVRYHDTEISLEVVVVRKEIEPRSGLGLRIQNMSGPTADSWDSILTRAQRGLDPD